MDTGTSGSGGRRVDPHGADQAHGVGSVCLSAPQRLHRGVQMTGLEQVIVVQERQELPVSADTLRAAGNPRRAGRTSDWTRSPASAVLASSVVRSVPPSLTTTTFLGWARRGTLLGIKVKT